MKNYYNQWKFKHPKPVDFKKVMEKASGMELDWYFDYFITSTNKINYAIKSVNCDAGITKITIENKGDFPMPLDISVILNDGTEILYNIPLRVMRGAKTNENKTVFEVLEDWPWVYPDYAFSIEHDIDEIQSINIDPSQRLADVDQDDNVYPNQKTIIFESK